MTNDPMVQLAVNTIGTLSIDAVQAAGSGHPGDNWGVGYYDAAPSEYLQELPARYQGIFLEQALEISCHCGALTPWVALGRTCGSSARPGRVTRRCFPACARSSGSEERSRGSRASTRRSAGNRPSVPSLVLTDTAEDRVSERGDDALASLWMML